MNSIHDRMHRNAFPSLAHLKRKALPLSLSLLGMVAGSLLPWSEAAGAGPTAGTLPTGGTVVSGTASISTTGTTLTVSQTSAQAAMNWTSFDIASNASVIFNQPSANAIALNRIGIGSSSPTASQIFGNLSANGQVFLINPAGIVFGAGATVNVGGLVASTLDMDPTTLAGGSQRFHLDNNTGTGASVVNHGTITAATGGGVVLAGGSVSNDGAILASAGHIFLDGADHATLDFDGNNLINVTVTGGLASGSGTAVYNSGTLRSDGGTVVLQASATPGLFTQMVNNSGVVQADGISAVNGGIGGSVQLIGSGGAISNGGTVSANGISGATAGSVTITSDQSVTSSGAVSTTGVAGGGISLNGGSLALSGDVNAGASVATLTSAAGITQSGSSVVTAGLLTGSSTGSTTLSNSNAIQSVGNFTSHDGFTLNNGSALQVGGLTANNGAVALTTTGTGSDLNFNGNVSAQSLSLNSGGAISQTGGVLNVGTLSGSSVGSTTLGQANQIDSLAGFSANGFSLVDASALDVSSAVNAQGGGVSLLTTSGGLNINGLVSGTSVSLTSAGALVLGADVAASQTLSLSGTAITQTGGALTTNLLTGQSIGDTSLNGVSNSVGQVGSFSAANFSLANAGALTVTGPLSTFGDTTVMTLAGDLSVPGTVSSRNVTLTGGNNLLLRGNVTASNTLTLYGAGINQTAGTLAATSLTGSSTYATSLTQANTISALGSFTASGFSLTNAGTLSMTGPVISSGGVSLTTTSGSLQLMGSLSGTNVSLSGNSGLSLGNNVSATSSLNLVSGNGAITQSAGVVSTPLLTGSSRGATMLNVLNQISQIGSFSADGFSLSSSTALSVNGPLTSTGDVTLSNTSGDLTLNGSVSGQRVSLISNGGAVTQTGGSLSANTLTGFSANGTLLSSEGNAIGSLGSYNSGGNFTLSTAGNLQLTGAINGNTVSLNAVNGSITEATGGSITASTLTGSSTGATRLDQVNQIGSLGNYNGGGDFSLTNGQAITQSGALQVQGKTTLRTGGQSITLTGNNNLAGPVSLAGGTTQINNSGPLTFDASTITGDLTATTTNATIGQVGALNVTGMSTFNAGTGAIALTNVNNALATSNGQTINATGTGIAISNSGDLHMGTLADGANGAISLVSGGALYLPSATINTGTADLTLVSNGGLLATSASLSGNNVTLSGGPGITLAHNVSATNTLSLNSSSGPISQTAGVLTANTLTGASQGATTLNELNQIAQLGHFSANGFSLSNDGTLAITGALNSGTLALNVNGAITEVSGGSMTANMLTGSSTGATTLNQANNQITQLGGFVANGFSLYNAGALSVTGPLSSIGNVALMTQSGDLMLAATVSGAGITLRADGGAILQQAGSLMATTLAGSSQGSTTLTQSGNEISHLGNFSANGFSLTNADALTVSGPLVSTGDVTLTTLSGDLTLAGGLNGTNVVVTASNGAVNQAGGSLTATTLSGQSTGATSLTQSGNAISQLGSYSSGGDFGLTDSVALTQSGPLQVLGNTTLNAGTNAIMLGNSGNDLHGAVSLIGGNTQIVNDRALTFGTSTIAGNLDATTANAAISQTGALSVAGTSRFNAGTRAVTLGNSANQLQGAVGLNGSDAQIANGRALVLGTSTLSGSLGANTANGAISQAGALNVAGASIFSAGTGTITLGDGANNLQGTVSITGGDTRIANSHALVFGTSTIAGNLDAMTANVAIGQVGALDVAGSSSFNAGTGTITLDSHANSLQGAVNIVGGDTQIANSRALVMGASSISGNLNAVTNNAAISQAGPLAVTGTSSLNAGTGSITLNDSGNDLHGVVDLIGGNTLVANGRDLILGASHISGNLGVTAANAAISQTGPLNVSGTSTFDAGTGAISLGNSDNDLAGAVSLIGGNAQIANGRALVFGTSNLSGNLDAATNNAAISQTGALSVADTSAFHAGTGTITLDQGNDLRGAVSLIGGDTEITNGGPLLFGASQINGNLSVTTTDPAIGQNGALSVTGSSYFDAGTGSIALTDANNHLDGQINATGTGIAITNAGDLHIAALSNGANGAVSLVSVNGTLILPNTAIATGTSDLLLMSGGGMLATAGVLSGANVALSGSGGVSLGQDISATNKLSVVSSNGAITQAGGVLNAGTLTGGSAGSTHLSQANLVRNVGSFSANGFRMNNADGLTISGPLSSTGDVSLTTQHGDLTLAGLLSGNGVTLDIAGAINENAAGSLVATTLSGSAGGATSLGTHDQPASNRIGTLGGFASHAGFSLTNDQTLTLASVNGSSYTLDAGTAPVYLRVRNGDLLQIGTTPLYDAQGTFAASERIGTAAAPLYVFGTQPQVVEFIGTPPAYFYAIDRQGNALAVIGGQSLNLTASLSYGRERSAIHRQDAYIDAGAVAPNGHDYSIVPPGIRLPQDQGACVPHARADCRSD